MALTPLDIKNKTFEKKMRGYNTDEVDDFLDIIINDYEQLLKEKKDSDKSLKHAEEKLTYFNELKDALNQSIIVAQDTADKLKDSAERESDIVVTTANADAKAIIAEANAEAEATIKDANNRAEEIVNDATNRAMQLAHETDDLKKKTRDFHRNLTILLESQLEIVRSKEWKEILKPFASYMDDSHVNMKELLDSGLDKEMSSHVESEGHTEAIDLSDVSDKSEEDTSTITD